MYTLHYPFSKGEYQPRYKSIKQVETTCLNRYKWKFQKSRVGFLGYVSIRVFDSDSIGCRCNIVKWEGDINHASLNTSALFSICMCCSSSIYDITVTTASTEIPRADTCHGREIERPYVYYRVAILDIWSPSGLFSWCIERLIVGCQKE